MEWSTGEDLNILVATPSKSEIFACVEDEISFQIIMEDFDLANCEKFDNPIEMDYPFSNYIFKYSSDSKNATFNGEQILEVGLLHIEFEEVPDHPDNPHRIIFSEIAKLKIDEEWDGMPININIEIIDVESSLPECHSGSPFDESLTGKWVISSSNINPDNLTRVNNIPPNNSWVPLPIGGVQFGYEAGSLPPPSYN